MDTGLVRLLQDVGGGLGVAGRARRIFFSYKKAMATMSNDNKTSSSETDKPWKLPGQSSQQPEQKGPPKEDRHRDYKDSQTA